MEGMIAVKEYTSAAEMMAAHAATRSRLMGTMPPPRRAISRCPARVGCAPKQYVVWSLMTTEQRCEAIRRNWYEGITAREMSEAINEDIGEKISRSAILATVYRHGAGLLNGITFTSSGGGNGRPRTRKEKPTVTANPSKIGCVKSLLSEGSKNVEAIIRAVCDWQGISVEEVKSDSRFAIHVLPRQKLMWVLAKNTKLSLVQIAAKIGGRDHTTALHSVKKIDKMIDDGDDRVSELKGWLE